jgi:Fungal Zn(2)-Cys(6) binuclear cluster domain
MSNRSQSQASSPEPQADQKPRSCFACYGRKVRCNRTVPCSNCSKSKARCVYPAPEGESKSSHNRRHMLAEVIDRLDRLEHLLKHNMGKPLADRGDEIAPAVQPSTDKKRIFQEVDTFSKRLKVTRPSGSSNNSWELLVGDGGRAGRYINNPVLADLFEKVSRLH